MSDFFRFPHTPHLAWLGSGRPRDDKVLSREEMLAFLAHEVVVEEKLDGANLGISAGPAGELRLQNRGEYLTRPFRGQFSRAASWLAEHERELSPALGDRLILFGEWCAARHSVLYDHLPDWLVAFDIYDRPARKSWSSTRRNAWAARLDLAVVPRLTRGRIPLAELEQLVIAGRSRFGSAPLEGVVIRQERAEFLEHRAKLVRPGFAQAIAEHWRGRPIEWNAVTAA